MTLQWGLIIESSRISSSETPCSFLFPVVYGLAGTQHVDRSNASFGGGGGGPFPPRGVGSGVPALALRGPVHTRCREKCYPDASIHGTKYICSHPAPISHSPPNTAQSPTRCGLGASPNSRPILPTSAHSSPATEPPRSLGYSPVALSPHSSPLFSTTALCPASGRLGAPSSPRALTMG